MKKWPKLSGIERDAYRGFRRQTKKVWLFEGLKVTLGVFCCRHPVRHIYFNGSKLVTANIPDDKLPRGACITDDDLTAHRRSVIAQTLFLFVNHLPRCTILLCVNMALSNIR